MPIRTFRANARLLALYLLVALAPAVGHATPIVVESGWQLVNTDFLPSVASARYNPIDGLVYAVQSVGNGGIYRFEADGTQTLLVTGDAPRAAVIDPDTGDLFYSESLSGRIYRVPYGTYTNQVWVSGWHVGDDDPVGMAIAPNTYTGSVVAPGEAIMVDEGNNGPKEIWGWSPDTSEGEFLIHGDDGSLFYPIDVAIGDSGVYVVDDGFSLIFEVQDSFGNLSAVPTEYPLSWPSGIEVDPITGDLLVLDSNFDQLLRIDPLTGLIDVVLEGLTLSDGVGFDVAGVDMSPDGSLLIVTDRGSEAVYTFSMVPMVPEPGSGVLLAGGLLALSAWRRRSAGRRPSA